MSKLPAIIGRVTFNIKQFNEKCREGGFDPFPIETYEIEVQDEEHFNISIRSLRNKLEHWWEAQSGRGDIRSDSNRGG